MGHIETSDTLEHDGTTYHAGDPIRIEGMTGQQQFIAFATNVSTGTSWVETRGTYGTRHVRLDRVKAPLNHKVLCAAHPRYTGQRKPRTGCPRCEAAFEQRKVSQ